MEIDFTRLAIPPDHGAVLIEPAPQHLPALVEENRRLFAGMNGDVGGVPLAEARRTLRAALGLGDAPLIVTGHQPDFIHAGVWAKHVAVAQLADAVGGIPVNLVVDHDAPRTFSLTVPRVDPEDARRVQVRYAQWPRGAALEGIPVAGAGAVAALRAEVAGILGPLHDASQLPVFWQALADPAGCRDWVDQVVRARRAVEHDVGVRVRDFRVSAAWYGPWICPLLADAGRFAAAYNAALAACRARWRISGRQRPMPDLHLSRDAIETALWIYQPGHPRRRLFLRPDGRSLTLLADHEPVATWPAESVGAWPALAARLRQIDPWVIRPRALVLTMWARLFLADLFIHGLGGARYDHITDDLVRRYFGFTPPAMSCVSATLRLPLDAPAVEPRDWARAQHALRDLRFNPQRHLSASAVAELAGQKQALIAEDARLREKLPADHAARRAVYNRIRALNGAMLERAPGALADLETRMHALARALQRRAVLRDRAYFFALHRRADLLLLVARMTNVAKSDRPAIV